MAKLQNKVCKLVIVKTEWDEYQVKVWDIQGRRSAADYFTDDRDDARDTARHMFDTSHTWALCRPEWH
jgi:hypothetical protein